MKLTCAILLASSIASAGSVKGTVLFEGEPPEQATQKRDADPKCGKDRPDEAVVVTKGKLRDVVVRIKNGTTNYYIYGAGLLYQITETATVTNTLTCHYDYRGSTVALTDNNFQSVRLFAGCQTPRSRGKAQPVTCSLRNCGALSTMLPSISPMIPLFLPAKSILLSTVTSSWLLSMA